MFIHSAFSVTYFISKEEKAEKLKLKKAIEKGNMEVAKIHAENAIRSINDLIHDNNFITSIHTLI